MSGTWYQWPGQQTGLYLAPDAWIAPIIARWWIGSIAEGKADPSGLVYDRNRYYDPSAGQFTQEDPIGLAGGMNLYGYANGDPANNSDPFGLCSVKDWTDCRIFSLTAGAGVGVGVKANFLSVGFEGEAAKAGVEGSLSVGADGFHLHGAGTAAALTGEVHVGSRTFGASAGTCSTDSGCTAGSIGNNIQASSNGDISVTAKLGIEVGVTLHVGETIDALKGAANFAYQAAAAQVKKLLPDPVKQP